MNKDYTFRDIVILVFVFYTFGYLLASYSNRPTTTPKTAVDIVNYTCTTFDDLTMSCVVNGRG